MCCRDSAETGDVQRRAGVLACPLEAPPCVRYVLTAACRARVLSVCSQGRLALRPARCWPGRCAAAARPAALCVGQHLPGRYQVRLPALELSRPHIHARPMHIHAWPSHYRSPLLTLLSRALSQRLASVSDVSSGSGSDGTAARGLCVWSSVCVCALWAARASDSARENRAQFR